MRTVGTTVARRIESWALSFVLLACTGLTPSPAFAEAATDSVDDLKALAFEDLFDVEVTSVSKRSQKLSQIAAAVTVLTGEDIRRSGHTSIPEALRMVPGLEVAQIDGNKWAITSRGFNNQFAQKLLVLIDGRSVYTPLFSGVYWDVQDVLMEDLDRIEVIRGPGGTVWGANAVNGVINIITKSAKDTQGILAQAGGGSIERGFGSLRFGGEAGQDSNLHYRVYGKGTKRAELDREFQSGGAGDDFEAGRGGFRMDWDATESDLITFQGDFYEGQPRERSVLTGSSGPLTVRGANLVGRWTRKMEDASQLKIQMFFDYSERRTIILEEDRNTFDAELQYDFDLTENLHTTVGLNYRVHDVRIQNTFNVSFNPDTREDHLAAGFVQGELALLDDSLFITAGSKFEYNEFSGFEYQPSIRAAWNPDERLTFWAAVSRAVRTPSQTEQDLRAIIPVDPTTFLIQTPNPDAEAEDLLAYEIGIRSHLFDRVTADFAAFYFEYENLISREDQAPVFNPPFAEFPSTLRNQRSGEVYGAEIEIEWRPIDAISLLASYSLLQIQLDRAGPVSSGNASDTKRSNPAHQIKFRAGADLPYDFEVDATIQFVDGVPAQLDARGNAIGSYWRGDLRVGWAYQEWLALDVVGQNLLQRRHAEFGGTTVSPSFVPRSVYAKATVRY